MNRNQNSRFATNPTNLDMSRSSFDRDSSVKTSFNCGSVVPFYIDEVLPGDTFSIDTSKVVRLQTLITPMMDNLYLDTYWFFCPNRLVWRHFKEFMGENTESAWLPETEYNVPQITAPSGGWSVGTIADYMGIPTGISNLSVNALPFRMYALIMNEWFRDQNLSDPLHIPDDEATVVGVNTGNYITDTAKGGKPFVAAKYFDYFTSCLPSPQRGPDVQLNFPGLEASVYGTGKGFTLTDSYTNGTLVTGGGTGAPTLYAYKFGDYNTGGQNPNSGGLSSQTVLGFPTQAQFESAGYDSPLYAAIGDYPVATINQLRMAFQIQKFYERSARGGSRYIEILKSFFGVTSPDARLQRPEYLGGNRIPININQIVQQSATASGSTPQGNVAAMSLTVDTHSDFTKSFVEHGFVIGLMVARYDHTYQQGLERMWSRRTKFDYYWPVFANIGEQAVLNKEIYATGTSTDDEVFGYNEAWADYRYKPNRVSSEMRSSYSLSLDSWHLADDYEALPSLSDEWIREDPSNVDRVLAVQSSNSNQLFCDIFVRNRTTRAMPMYSIPGLIDHH